ncbi:MAG: hypothetical protein AB7F43_00620 [Bacteriovoracia bacterium]
MAISQNLSIDIGREWLHELAKNELNPDEASVFNDMGQFDPKQLVEESCIQYLENLRDLFTACANVFNAYSAGEASKQKFSEVKIYGITNTPADFMLFRNNVKLVFSNTAHGIISVSFNQHVRGDLAVDGASISKENLPESFQKSREILAQLGPFMDISWTYQGEKVNPDRLVKYYFIEFVKASRVVKKQSTNQLLLKQIKALLKDQGIDL